MGTQNKPILFIMAQMRFFVNSFMMGGEVWYNRGRKLTLGRRQREKMMILFAICRQPYSSSGHDVASARRRGGRASSSSAVASGDSRIRV